MIKYTHIKADYKQILREPMTLLLYFVPSLLLIISKIGIIFLPKYIMQYFNVDILEYSPYILSCTLSIMFLMVGTATGFMMIDDKDGKIYELMQITPLGRKGYLFNRLFLPVIITFLYSIIAWMVLDLNNNLLIGIIVSILLSSETIIIGIILFHVAEDKVAGLTYAKALSFYSMFSLIDLVKVDILIYIGHLLPVFWISRIIKDMNITTVTIGILVHFVWVYSFIKLFNGSED